MSCKPISFERDLNLLSNFKLIKKYEYDFFSTCNGYLETLNILEHI